jgi:ribosome maturation factor RimP
MQDKIRELIQPVVKQLNLTIYDIEYVVENNTNFLRIYLDKEQGITLNDVVDATKAITDVLDQADPITEEYVLEVSSPGAERPLNAPEQLTDAIDEYIFVKFVNPQDGMAFVTGYLRSFKDNVLEIEYLVKNIKKKMNVKYNNVAKAHLAIKF